MLFGMAAASSALDLIKTLTHTGASSKSNGSTKFAAATDSSSSSSSASTGLSGASGQNNLIAPDTMNALFAAQGQSASATTSTSRSDALKDLFNTLDADGSGGISKSEFENALGAGGTNTANTDSVFNKLDTDGDGSVSASELSSALKGKHHAHGPKGGGGAGQGEDALMQAIDGANATTTSNSDGSTTSTVTYADGSTVTMTTAASSSSSTATRSYNAIEQMLQQQVNALSKSSSVSSSVSVSA